MANLFLPAVLPVLVAAPFVGSFLGLLADRLPRHEAVVFARSRCRTCQKTLTATDLIPVLSWIGLRGHCRHCHAAIGVKPLGFELGGIGVALWAAVTVPPALVGITAALGWALLVLAVIDAREMILPDAISLPLLVAGPVVALVFGFPRPGTHVVGIAAGFAALGGVRYLFRALRGKEGLGLGDVKLFAAAGGWLGWESLPGVLLIAALFGLAAALPLLARNGRDKATGPIAFGPWLCLGFWISWLYGPLALP